MDFYEQLAREAYLLSRAAVQGGAKSTNKVYDPSINENRANLALQRVQTAAPLLSIREYNLSAIEVGWVTRATGSTFANCEEMASLAASFVADRAPHVPLFRAAFNTADHVLLVVGEMPRNTPFKALAELTSPRGQPESYAVDPWLGIHCELRNFPARVQEKMEKKWRKVGKVVRARSEVLHPQQWLHGLMQDSLTATDARLPRLLDAPAHNVLAVVLDLERRYQDRQKHLMKDKTGIERALADTQMNLGILASQHPDISLRQRVEVINRELLALKPQLRSYPEPQAEMSSPQGQQYQALRAELNMIAHEPKEYLEKLRVNLHGREQELTIQLRDSHNLLTVLGMRAEKRDNNLLQRLVGQHQRTLGQIERALADTQMNLGILASQHPDLRQRVEVINRELLALKPQLRSYPEPQAQMSSPQGHQYQALLAELNMITYKPKEYLEKLRVNLHGREQGLTIQLRDAHNLLTDLGVRPEMRDNNLLQRLVGQHQRTPGQPVAPSLLAAQERLPQQRTNVAGYQRQSTPNPGTARAYENIGHGRVGIR